MITLTNIRREIINLNTNTSYVDGAIAGSINAIGEKKRLIFDYEVGVYDSLEGYVLYVNMALFMPKVILNPINKRGEIYWQAVMPDSIVGASSIVADLVSTATFIQKEAFKNYQVSIEIVDSRNFQVVVDFYNTFDVLGYMTNELALMNKDRFVKDRYNNANELTLAGQSIYTNTNYDGRIYVYAESKVDNTDYGSVETLFGDYKANWYGGYPYLYGNEPDVTFSYFVNGIQVQTLSNVYPTKVKVAIQAPDYMPVLYIQAFKKNKTDNTIDFVENASVESKKIEAGQPNGNIIIGPFVTPTDPFGFGGYYEAEFYINPEYVELGDDVYLIAMLYNSPTTDVVSSFIAKTPPVAGEVPYDGGGMNFSGELIDYYRSYSGNDLTCAMEERMLSKVAITYGGDLYKNDIFNRLGIVVPNNILTYLTKIRFKIYENAPVAAYNPYQPTPQEILNYLDEREMVKQKNNPSIFSGQTGEFAAIVGTEAITLYGYWRNRYESNVDCIRSVIDGVDYGSKLMSQYWGGHNLTVEWQLEFFYDNIDSPFTDIVVHRQTIRVKDYLTDIQITAQTAEDEAKDSRCLTDDLKYQTEYTPPTAEEYRVVNNIEVNPGSISTIEEADSWTSPTLTQKTTTKIPIASQEYYIGQTVVDKQLFDIAEAQLAQNTYRISSVVKRIIPLIP
jgi:hypothetical protein